MTIEEFDSRVRENGTNQWILDVSARISYMWTGWKRKNDPRLMISNDPTIPLEPIDDTLFGQWLARTNEIYYYTSVPGGGGICNTSGQVLDCEVKPSQTVLTIHSSPDLLEHCRKEGLSRLIVTMEKLGAIDGPNFSAA